MKQTFTTWQPTTSYKLALTGDPTCPQKTVQLWTRDLVRDNGCIMGKREVIGIQTEWRDLELIERLAG